MKKFTIMALAVCLTVVMAAPVMAVDVDFSGAYRVRGAYVSHWDLTDKSSSVDFMDMRFRLQTVFKVTDNLSVTTRFDALEKVWGDGDLPAAPGDDNIDFDRAYMTIKTDFGKFDVGRMKGGAWGTSFVDNEGDFDRIKFTKVMDNLTTIALYQKNAENDDLRGLADTYSQSTSDEDSENYYLLNIYKMENITAGLLLAFNNNKTVATQTTHKYIAIPYFVSKFGPLAIQGELAYNWGQTDYDAVGTVDRDIKELAYNIEASYDFGFLSALAGYAYVSGDENVAADNEDSAYGGVGDDWEKLFILTTDEVPGLVNLGGAGNLSRDGVAAAGADYGAKIIYAGASVKPVENVTLGFVIGKADADEIPAANTKDDYGVEYDFTLNWKIYDNLSYTAIAAFLSAGDIWWEQAGYATEPNAFEDTYALFHQLQLSF
ncbi:MAG: hypothetical protein SRB1_00210 [Desulfobacteraceae bacterium Eth-SRB1]|nr:MAG: hypothetical protein SRB1_00210 [Desulfobacteraceae bacterium Eth-SRB1]